MTKTYYAPCRINRWSSVQPSHTIPKIEFIGVGVGFIPVYETREECEREWPGAYVIPLQEVVAATAAEGSE